MGKIKVNVEDGAALSRWPCDAPEPVLVELVAWPVGYAIRHIAERAFCVAFARPVQAVQQCCPLTILVRAEEQDVFTTPTDHPQGIFGDVLICVGSAIVDFFNQSVFRTSAVFPFFACVLCASTCFASHPSGRPSLNQHQDEPHFTRAA